MLLRKPHGWELPERLVTPESAYLNRRRLLQAAGLSTLPAAAAPTGVFPAKRNPQFTLDRPVTPEWAATGFNNYYEFTTDKERVKDRVSRFQPNPWTLDIGGLVAKPMKLDLDDLVKRIPIEERVCRFRCVEAWAMAVPWTGFPFAELVKLAQPKPEAKWVRYWTIKRPAEMPGINEQPWYSFPYYEALRMDEAMNPLAFVAIGLYGKLLPKQNGAPIRMVLPWKYGFKGPKSIVRIEFAGGKQPGTFWNDLQASEYGFYGNVNPKKPHPRWSQSVEKLLPTMERRDTLLYNGYEKWVAGLYNGKEY
jgi:sulfoxide reductase catalytic subunit YedY